MTLSRRLPLLALLLAAACFRPALAGGGDAAGGVPAQVLSERGLYRVELLEVPEPLPRGEHFSLRLRVVSLDHPDTPLRNAKVSVEAGMRHGREQGFAHGMQSQPVVSDKEGGQEDGVVLVEGLYFHMGGAWTLKLTVDGEDGKDQVWLTLPCCEG